MSWRVALLTVPAIVLVAVMNAGERLSSPTIDLPAFVLVFAGGVSLAQAYERSLDMRSSSAASGLSLPGLRSGRRSHLRSSSQSDSCSLPLAGDIRDASFASRVAVWSCRLCFVVGLGARQTVLSGYPLLPVGDSGCAGRLAGALGRPRELPRVGQLLGAVTGPFPRGSGRLAGLDSWLDLEHRGNGSVWPALMLATWLPYCPSPIEAAVTGRNDGNVQALRR